jgi:uncharacterized cupredoxin-like copper-binding protein
MALVAAIAVACGGGGGNGGITIKVSLTDYKIAPSVASAAAGKITFETKNDGAVDHELVVIKTDLAPDKLPKRAGEPKVDEAAAGQLIGEIEEFGPGKTESKAFDLAAGKYVLICNIAGHYELGMHAPFEVK